MFNEIGIDIADIFTKAGLTKSKSEARRHIISGSIKINNIKVRDQFARLVLNDNDEFVLVENINDKILLTIVGIL